jgi:protein-S-isoprenylcysteine O-methyltransferase Ste14
VTLQFKFIVFVVLCGVIAWLVRASLLNFRSHGFYRFFAWMAIIALMLLNIEHWFLRPFSVPQLISWFFLIISGYLVIHGALVLRMMGKPSSMRSDETLYRIEKTTELVTDGPYRYIRHPLYSSLFFLAWGTFFKLPSWAGTLLAVTATSLLVVTAKIEEVENIRYFGDEYLRYMKKSKMLLPYLF